jgi:hypothetical protein
MRARAKKTEQRTKEHGREQKTKEAEQTQVCFYVLLFFTLYAFSTLCSLPKTSGTIPRF